MIVSGDYIQLSYWQVGLAASLVLINGIVSLVLHLGLGRRLLVAAVRTSAQLLLSGLVLHFIFAISRWYWVVALMLVMTSIAGVAAVRRTARRFPGVWWNSVVSVSASCWAVTMIALFAVVGVDPWYSPQYAIPLLGMMLGNSLTGISLALDHFGRELDARRAEVEARLTLGATRWEAAHAAVREAVRTGMVPILNAMTVAGIVSLPGMMTGQLLAGVDPLEAVKYQIVIMFLLAAATALGTVGVVALSYRRLFNAHHQFRHDIVRTVDAA